MDKHLWELKKILAEIELSKFYSVYVWLQKVKQVLKLYTNQLKSPRYVYINLLNLIYRKLLPYMPRGKVDVIVFGIIAYRYRKQRPQHLCEELVSRGHRVFYIENGFIPRKNEHSKDPYFVVHQQHKNLFLVSLSASKDVSIYKELAGVSDKKMIFISLDRLFRRYGIRKLVKLVEHPFWAQVAPFISGSLIYDCMDEHAGFRETGKDMIHLEQQLVRLSDRIIVTSNYLAKKWKKYGAKTVLMQNAGEFEYFRQASTAFGEWPHDLPQGKRIIGYYGAIAEWFDVEVVEAISEKFSDAAVVLIGEITNNSFDRLRKRQNVHLLGEKKYTELLPYLSRFDVCLIPFILIPLIRATNPVKIFEYFATGKPVVVTNLPELYPYKNSLYLAKDKKQFVNMVSQALKENDPVKRQSRIQISQENTWKKRGEQLHVEVQGVQRKYGKN